MSYERGTPVVAGFRVWARGVRVSSVGDFRFRVSGFGFPVSDFRFRIPGLKFTTHLGPVLGARVSGFEFEVPGSGFEIPDFEFRVPASRLQIPDAGFR